MRAVVQRVSSASVEVEGRVVGEVGWGFLVLLGVRRGDTADDAAYLARKIQALRVFADEAGKMNLSIVSAGGAVLAVSQFTLYADLKKGNRPSFLEAAAPDDGRRLFGAFVEALRDLGLAVDTGVFGADMKVSLVGDGPVTIILESEERARPR